MSNLIAVLHGVSSKLNEIENESQIYEILNDGIKQILPDSYFIITKLQPDDMNFRIIQSFGFDKYFTAIKALIGKDPFQMDFPFSDLTETMQEEFESRKLYHASGGIYEIANGRVNKTICKTIEKIIDISEVYAISFCIGEKYFGGSTLLIPKTNLESGKLNKECILTIESLASIASFAINKLRDLEILSQKEIELKVVNKELIIQNEEKEKRSSELRKANERIVESEKLLSVIARNYPNSFLSVINKDLTIGFSSGEEFYKNNLNPDDYVGLTLEQVFGENSETIKRHYLKAFSGEKQTFELIIGNQYQQYKVVPLYSEKNEIPQILAVVENITERKLAEKALKESDERWKALLQDNPNLALQGYDKNGETIYWNKASETFYGYSSDEAIGRKLTDLIIPEELKGHVSAAIKEMFTNKTPIPASELKLKCKDGSLLDVFSSHSYFQVPGREPEMYCLDIDISERKQAEAELLNAEEKYRIITQASLDIIFIIDKTGKIIFSNESMSQVLGYQPNEFLGKSFTNFVPKKEIPKYFIKLTDVYKHKEIRDFETQVYHKEGHLVDIEINGKLIKHEGKLVAQGTIRDISERKQAEEALKISEEEHRYLFENTPTGVIYLNTLGEITHANKAAVSILGISLKEMYGLKTCDPRWKATHEDGRDYRCEELPAIISLKTGKTIKNAIMYVFNPTSNSDTIIRINSLPKFKYNEAKPYQIITTFEDITKQTKAEKELLDSKEKYADAQAIAHLGHWEIDIINNNLTCSDEIYKMFDLDPDKFKVSYDTFLDHIHPDERDMVKEAYLSSIQNKTIFEIEHRVLLKSGIIKCVQEKCVTQYNVSGEPIRSLGTILDITERKKAEKKLLVSEERFRLIAENAGEWVWEVDTNGLYTFVSPVVEDVLGFKPEDLIGRKHFFDLLLPQDKEKIRKFTLDIFAAKTPIRHFINTNLHKNGSKVIIETNGVAILDKQGNLLGYRGADADITERKREKDAIRDSKERIQMLNKIIRHDLANDLTVINSAVKIFKRTSDQTMMSEIEKRVRKTLDTIGKYKKQEAFIDSHTLLSEMIIEDVVNKIARHHPELKIEVTGEGKAYADELLYSIFENLINNAKIHGKAKKINITINNEDQLCVIRVADNGSGIPDRIKDKIFNEGFVHGETGHTGIGLYIVKQTI